MKEVTLIARFPEQQYCKNGIPLELFGSGEGSTLAVAMNRAFRSVLTNPLIRYKVPKYIHISVGIDGFHPIKYWVTRPSADAEAVKGTP